MFEFDYIETVRQLSRPFNLILIKYRLLIIVQTQGQISSRASRHTNFAPQTIVSIRSTNLPWKRKQHVTLSKHREETKSRAISPCLFAPSRFTTKLFLIYPDNNRNNVHRWIDDSTKIIRLPSRPSILHRCNLNNLTWWFQANIPRFHDENHTAITTPRNVDSERHFHDNLKSLNPPIRDENKARGGRATAAIMKTSVRVWTTRGRERGGNLSRPI